MKCEICQEREAGCVLHRKRDDGGTDELYVCTVCRDEHDRKAKRADTADTAMDSAEPGGLDSILGPAENPSAFFDTLLKKLDGFMSSLTGGAGQPFFRELTGSPDAPEGDAAPGDLAGEEFEFENGDPRETACGFCGMTRTTLRQGQRLGCPECYEVFGHEVALLVRDMHRGTKHAEDNP